MFTGLIERVAKVESFKKIKDVYQLCIKLKSPGLDVKIGDSVAVNGVCLTVTRIVKGIIYFEVINKTFKNTNLCFLKRGETVNLERALFFGERLGGHFVQGHIDSVVEIKAIRKKADGLEFTFSLDKENRPFIVPKGSVALDGVSLTVQEVTKKAFSVYIIPYTLKKTNFKERKMGDKLNLEVDILAKYTQAQRRFSLVTEDFLKKHGF
jgi:riboflavin synthase